MTTTEVLIKWIEFQLNQTKNNRIIVATHIIEQNIQRFVGFQFPTFKRNTATFCRMWRKVKRNPPNHLTIFKDNIRSENRREDYYVVVRKEN